MSEVDKKVIAVVFVAFLVVTVVAVLSFIAGYNYALGLNITDKRSMQKKAKIIRTVFKNEWKGPNGTVYFHHIELDNGDTGSIGAKESMPAKLNPGNELTYTIEPDPDPRGDFKIKAVSASNGGVFPGGGKKGPDPKVQIVGFAMAYTKDLVVADKIKIDQLPAIFEKIHSLMASKL